AQGVRRLAAGQAAVARRRDRRRRRPVGPAGFLRRARQPGRGAGRACVGAGGAMKGLLRILLELLQRFARTLDLPLLAGLLALMGIGLATQFSAGNESLRGVAMQGAFYCVGLGALWVASRLPAHLLKQATPA